MRTAIYCRLSKDDTGLAENVEIQEKECRAYAGKMGWEIVGVYTDNDLSASSFSTKPRPGYLDLLAAIEAGQVDAIVVTEATRLNRKLWDSIDLFRLAQRDRGLPFQRISTTDGGGFDLSTDEGIYSAIGAAIEAQKESRRISDRVRRKVAVRASQGQLHGGPRPFGYRYVPATYQGRKLISPARLEVNEREAGILREAAAEVIRGRPLRSLVVELNAAGKVRDGGRSWWPRALRDALIAPRVAGLRDHLGQLHPAQWPAILDRETWERVCLILKAEDRRKNNGKEARSYLLTGFVVCGLCGAQLVGQGGRDSKGKPRRRYYCLARDSSGGTHGCGKISRVGDPIDLLVTESLLYRIESGQMAEALGTAAVAGEEGKLLADYQAHRERLAEARHAYGEGIISLADWTALRSQIEAKLEAVQRQLDRLAGSRSFAALPPAATVRERWDAADLHWRRDLLAMTVKSVKVGTATTTAPPLWPPADDPLATRAGRQWRFDPALIEITWKV